MRILLLWTCAGADFGWQQFSSSRYFEIGLVSASPPFSLKGATSIYYYILLREKGERYNSGNLFPYCTVILYTILYYRKETCQWSARLQKMHLDFRILHPSYSRRNTGISSILYILRRYVSFTYLVGKYHYYGYSI